MADAYKCDVCPAFDRDPLHEGRPSKKLFEEDHDRAQKKMYLKVLDLCDECAVKIGVSDQDD